MAVGVDAGKPGVDARAIIMRGLFTRTMHMDSRNKPIGELNQFLYGEGYDRLCAALSSTLGHPVSAVIHKNQVRIEVDEDSVYYVFRAGVEYAAEKSDDLRLTCKVSFDGMVYSYERTTLKMPGTQKQIPAALKPKRRSRLRQVMTSVIIIWSVRLRSSRGSMATKSTCLISATWTM